jgi:hypothetical protein
MKLAISSTEPVIAIVVPTRLLPQLMALLAVAANAAPVGACVVETTAEPAPASRPGLAKVLPLATKLKRLA